MLLRLSCVSGWLALLGAVAGLPSLIPVATGDEFVPRAHQLDISLDNFSGFVARTSQVHVRENTLTGSRFHLASALGLRRMDIPSIVLTYWFDDRNAIQIHFRYFDAAGSHRLRQPATFNGNHPDCEPATQSPRYSVDGWSRLLPAAVDPLAPATLWYEIVP